MNVLDMFYHLLSALVVVCCMLACATAGSGSGTGNSGSEMTSTSKDLDGRPYLPALELTLELINNNTDILPGYWVQATVNDSACDAGPSVRSFIDQVFLEPTKIAMIGPVCSTATQPVAELAHFWNLVLISPGASNPRLSDTTEYPTFLRSVSSDTGIVDGISILMDYYDWSRIAVITQQEFLFTAISSELNEAVSQKKFSEMQEFLFESNTDPQFEVEQMAASPMRIIFINTYPTSAVEIICKAQSLGLTPDNGYVWLLFSWYGSDWWTREPVDKDYQPFSCNIELRESMVNKAIAIDHFAFVAEEDYDVVTDIGVSRAEYESLYYELLEQDFSDLPEMSKATIAFTPLFVDAVWTIALALDEYESESDIPLSEFTYDSSAISAAIYENAVGVNFLGVTGEVSYKPNGDRDGYIRYFQFRRNLESTGLTSVFIGDVDNDTLVLTAGETNETIFINGKVPTDERLDYIDSPLFITYTILSIAGIAYATFCLLFNLLCYKKKVVKLSSPFLNVLIITGCIMIYFDIILFGIDQEVASTWIVNGLCMTRIWIASVAFTLVFGTFFAKTWRVYYIFHSSSKRQSSKKCIIHDMFLFLLVAILLLIDIIFLIIATSIPSIRLELENRELASNDPQLPVVIAVCSSSNNVVLLPVMFVYKGLLLVVGIFLAFETRDIKIKELNDSKLIVMCVFSVVMVSISTVPIAIVLENSVDLNYILIGLMLLLGVTTLLSVLFIPKIYSLIKDPSGQKVMTTNSGMSITNAPDSTETLKSEIQRLKSQLAYARRTSTSESAMSITSPREMILGDRATRKLSYSYTDSHMLPNQQFALHSHSQSSATIDNSMFNTKLPEESSTTSLPLGSPPNNNHSVSINLNNEDTA